MQKWSCPMSLGERGTFCVLRSPRVLLASLFPPNLCPQRATRQDLKTRSSRLPSFLLDARSFSGSRCRFFREFGGRSSVPSASQESAGLNTSTFLDVLPRSLGICCGGVYAMFLVSPVQYLNLFGLG